MCETYGYLPDPKFSVGDRLVEDKSGLGLTRQEWCTVTRLDPVCKEADERSYVVEYDNGEVSWLWESELIRPVSSILAGKAKQHA